MNSAVNLDLKGQELGLEEELKIQQKPKKQRTVLTRKVTLIALFSKNSLKSKAILKKVLSGSLSVIFSQF